jgi:hypothetical protein
MTRVEDMASGLFVQIERVFSDNFPLVEVEIQVQDRLRRPVVGLDAGNFLLSEQGYTAAEQNFLGASFRNTQSDISILIERSPETLALRDELAAAVRDINAAVQTGGKIVSVVSAGEQPWRENPVSQTSSQARGLEEAARGVLSSYSPRWRFDAGLRLAATDLLPGERKRAVVFVGAGTGGASLSGLPFEQYGISELASYLANNGVVFYAVITGNAEPAPELAYLCAESGGQVLFLYRNEGIGALVKNLVQKPSGYYSLSYRSNLSTDFGRSYLPLEAEVYLLDRSGRDSTGYFPPLE